MTDLKKRMNKIYKKINLIAQKGKDNVYDYYKYIDELINNGEYGDLELTLSYFYKLDTIDYSDVDLVKKKTWKEIMFNTNSPFSVKLKKIYDDKNVYQISNNIYTTSMTSSSVFLGRLKEVDVYTQEVISYLVESKEYSKILGYRKTNLEVDKSGEITILDTNDTNLSPDQNLLNKYSLAVDILLEP